MTSSNLNPNQHQHESEESHQPIDFWSIWPPVNLLIQEDDRSDSLLMAICATFVSVNNRALCPKEIAQVIFYLHRWAIPPCTSQPFGAVSASIRNHIRRSKLSEKVPLLTFYTLVSAPSTAEQRCMGILSEAKPTVKRSTLWFLNPLSTGLPDPFEGVPEKGVRRNPKNPNQLNSILIPTLNTPINTPNLTPTSPQPSIHPQSNSNFTGMKIKLKWSGATSSLQNESIQNQESISSTSNTSFRSSNLRVNIKLNQTSLTPQRIEEEGKPDVLSSISPTSYVDQNTSDSDQSSDSSDHEENLKSIEIFQGLIRPTSIHRRKPKELDYNDFHHNLKTQRLSSIFSTFYPPLFESLNSKDQTKEQEDLKPIQTKTEEEDGMLVDHELWPSIKSNQESSSSKILKLRREEESIEEIESDQEGEGEEEEEEEEDSDSRKSAEPEDYAEMMVSRTDEWDKWRERRKSDPERIHDSNCNTPKSFSFINSTRRLSGLGLFDEDSILSDQHHSRTTRERSKSRRWVSNQLGFGSNQDLNVTLLEDEIELNHNSDIQRNVSNEDSRIEKVDGSDSIDLIDDDQQGLIELDSSIITEPITLIEQVPTSFDDLNEEPILIERPPDLSPTIGLDQSLTSLADKLGFTSLCETRIEDGENSFEENEEEDMDLSEDESLDCKPMLSESDSEIELNESNRNRIRKKYELDEEDQERILKRLKLDLVENLNQSSSSSSPRRRSSLTSIISSPLSTLSFDHLNHHHEHIPNSFEGSELDEDDHEVVVVNDDDEIALLEELDEVWNETINPNQLESKSIKIKKEEERSIKAEERSIKAEKESEIKRNDKTSLEFLTSASKPKQFKISNEMNLINTRTTLTTAFNQHQIKLKKSLLNEEIGEVWVLKLVLMIDFLPYRNRKFGNDWVLIRRIENDSIHFPSLIGILKIEEEEIEKIIQETLKPNEIENDTEDDREREGEIKEKKKIDWIELNQAKKIIEKFECIISLNDFKFVKRFLSDQVD